MSETYPGQMLPELQEKTTVDSNDLFYMVSSNASKKIKGSNLKDQMKPSDYTGATSSTNGANGLVPQPTTSDVDRFLKGDGTWGDISYAVGEASGSIATFSDGSPLPMRSLKAYIEPVQDLHGYDRPWVGGSGKNKLPIVLANIKSLNTSGTWSGNTYTKNGVSFICEANQDGYLTKVTANGQATDEVALRLLQQSIDFSSGSIASGITGGSWSTYLLEFVPSSYSERTYVTNGSVALFNTNVFIIEFTIRSRVAVNNVVAQPMIRLATETDATFAPYASC